jgi:hypothetical protein
MFNPNNVTRTNVSRDPREQSATSTKTRSNDTLSERMPSLVSATYGHDEAFVSSRLPVLFHTASSESPSGFNNPPQYRMPWFVPIGQLPYPLRF